MRRFVAVAALTLALVACSSEPDVRWVKYPAGTQDRIDASSDCRELQGLFDAFADMDDAVRRQHGEGSGDVMTYIDGRLEEVGCY